MTREDFISELLDGLDLNVDFGRSQARSRGHHWKAASMAAYIAFQTCAIVSQGNVEAVKAMSLKW